MRLLADGRVYTGRQALAAKLIDAIGGEDVARPVARREPGAFQPISQIIDWTADDSLGPSDFGLMSVKALLDALGLGGSPAASTRRWRPAARRLDGLLSVWHPDDPLDGLPAGRVIRRSRKCGKRGQ